MARKILLIGIPLGKYIAYPEDNPDNYYEFTSHGTFDNAINVLTAEYGTDIEIVCCPTIITHLINLKAQIAMLQGILDKVKPYVRQKEDKKETQDSSTEPLLSC